ncbi:MAG: hypothetical protein FGM27_04380 [Candidatus Omnitrophica bacterium]|nr:hypothetical protein [Candidatus Omnitrophota bacterium]
MKLLKPLSLSLMTVFLAAVSGCGYTQKTVLPENIKTVYVDTVKNKIAVTETYAYVPGLEIDITNAVIRRLHKDGNLKVVGEREGADAVLEMDLVSFEQEGLRFSSLESVEEYRMFIVLSMRLIHGATQNVLWEEPNFSGDSEYYVSDVRSLNREEASRRAIDRLARNVVDRIVEDW